MAMTTSFTVPPVASFSRLMLSSDAERMANRRWAVIDRFHGVGGAAVSGRLTRGPSPGATTVLIADPAWRATAPTLVSPADSANSRTRRSCVRAALAGLRTRLATVSRSSSASVGSCSGSHGRFSPGGSASGVVSCIRLTIIDAGRAVDRGVVVLRQQRPATALQALDDVDLPQRPAAVHRPPDDPRDLLGELVRPPGRGEAEVADVEVEVEVGVEHPVRVVEVEGHLDDAPAHRLELADERAPALVDRVERVEVGARPLVDGEPADVAERRGRLHVEEAAVEPRELLHALSFAGCANPP